ncbi:MAG: N-acetylmuramoyl-L-alanine amidase [Lentisphaeria bacterium]|nr:N-acetylmuramoyl-L-alanine amidase [Lentisphaeria bacterium]
MTRPAPHLIPLIIVLALFGLTCRGAFQIRTIDIDKNRYLLFADVARYYGMVHTHRAKDIRCQSRYSLMTFTVDDRRCVVNNVKITLCLPVKASGGHAFISETDFRLTLDPLLRTSVLSAAAARTVVIDPGHGGKDPGAAGAGTQEKEINLSVARRVAGALKKKGFRVFLTRTKDTFMTLDQRVTIAAKYKPDVFISLHANSADAGSAKGVETYVATPKGTKSTHGSKTKSTSSPGNKHDKESMRLAFELQKYLLHYTKAEDRGIKRANFVVIRDAPAAAALIELGFLSNPGENKKLAEAAYRDKLAYGIIQGVVAYDKALRAP